jgi:23S rRNA pseudouridine2605 synthase
LVHKPKGYVTSKSDPEGRPTVMQLLPVKYQHLHPVGRLDYDTSGALLLTDDGTLTNLLTHPSHGVTKTYWARVRGQVTVPTLKKLEAGIYLEDGKTAPCRAKLRAQTEQNALVEISLHEGRNRQVRRMLESVGHPVRALRRVRFAQLDLSGLPSGAYRVLLPGEVHQLHKSAEAEPKPRPRQTKKPLRPATKPARPTSTGKPATAARPKATAQPKTSSKGGGRKTASTGAHPLAARIERQWGQKTRKR